MTTHTYNSACMVLHSLFGDRVEVKGDPAHRAMFYVDGKAVAQYKESTGILAFTTYGKERQKAAGGGRTIYCYCPRWGLG